MYKMLGLFGGIFMGFTVLTGWSWLKRQEEEFLDRINRIDGIIEEDRRCHSKKRLILCIPGSGLNGVVC